MTNDLEIKDSGAAEATSERRIPKAVWINRPSALLRGARLAVEALGAALLLGLAALAVMTAAAESLAVAGVEPGAAVASGPIGYFPRQFDQRRLAPGEQPPAF
jgi:4-amino-4-deoxy-L-arabinose transferase-like glycosyltransferase